MATRHTTKSSLVFIVCNIDVSLYLFSTHEILMTVTIVIVKKCQLYAEEIGTFFK